MKRLFHEVSLGITMLILAFQITAGVVISSLPAALPTVAGIVVVATLPVTVGADKCSKDQLVSSAQDVLDVVTDKVVMDALRNISPFALSKLTAIIPTAKELVAAVKAAASARAADLVNAIFPVISDIAVQLGNNSTALAVLALANVGLHYLLNRLPNATVKAAKAQGGVTAQTATGLESFKAERVWGCDYLKQDKRCASLAH